MSVLRRRGVAPLLTAEVVSSFGSQMSYLALPWFVLVTSGSATRMSVVLAVELIPVALLGVPSGMLIARLGARRTMLLGDAARAPLMASIPALYSLGALSFPLLLVIACAIGCFVAPYFSAQRLILPELVGDDERTVSQANAFVEGAQRATALLGPSTAGVLISVIGATAVLYVDAATFVFSFFTLLLLVPQGAPQPASDEGRGVLAGVRFVFRDPLLRMIAPTALVLNGLGQLLTISLPVLAYLDFGGSARIAGIFFASFGAGAVVGSLVAIKLAPRFDPIKLAAAALVGLTVPIPLLALHLPAWGVVGALFVSSLFGPLVNAPLIGVITTRTPAALRAKVMTGVMTASALGGPVGRLAVGPVYEWHGLAVVFGAIALTMSVGAALFVAVAARAGDVPPAPAAAGAPAA